MAWHCCGIVLAVCSYVSMSSQGMLSSVVRGGSCILMSWFVGVSVLCASLWLCCCCSVGADVAGAGGGGWLFRSSCCTASGAFGLGITGMSGQFVLKHLGCQDSPQLLVFLTLHSRPWKSRLQMEQVALVWGTRCGCMMVYVLLGRTMERRCRLARVVLLLPVVVCAVAGPGCDASPTRMPRRPYIAFRVLLMGGSGNSSEAAMFTAWKGLWSPSSDVNVVYVWCWGGRHCCWCVLWRIGYVFWSVL